MCLYGPENDVMTKRHPDVSEPEEGFIVAEEEVQGGDVLHRTTPLQKGLHMLEKKPIYCLLFIVQKGLR